MIYDGIFANGKSYTIWQIMKMFRLTDKRPAIAWLEELDIPTIPAPKGNMLVLGDDINLALAEAARCSKKPKPEA